MALIPLPKSHEISLENLPILNKDRKLIVDAILSRSQEELKSSKESL